MLGGMLKLCLSMVADEPEKKLCYCVENASLSKESLR
jgi:hypothetical protein